MDTLDSSQVSIKNCDKRQASRAQELFKLTKPKSHGNMLNITADTVCTSFRKTVKLNKKNSEH